MSTTFIHDDFLLETDEAIRLYHDYAKDMPIIDYHCHSSPHEIADNIRWDNIAQIWLYDDHYKWRAMRTHGIDERYCTGDASDREKFDNFAETVPHCLRNPLYHWTHLEMARYFDMPDILLSPETADEVWERSGKLIQDPAFNCRHLIDSSNVKLICTTDDPADDLESHKKIAADDWDVKVLPAWRPDKALKIESPDFNAYIDTLAAISNTEIKDYDGLLNALKQRHDYFHAQGCRLSDYDLSVIYAADFTASEVEKTFATARSGGEVSPEDAFKYKSALLLESCRMNHASGWVMQYHIGALRDNSKRMRETVGLDRGFSSVGDWNHALPLAKVLNILDENNQLPQTILYNNNSRDNDVMATMIGNFQDGSMPGKLQHGSGWWFADQKDGMEKQIESLSQLGLLSHFIGMLTDSRSFVSYTRHEYFRRILCNILGHDMTKGLVPEDYDMIGQMVKKICYDNAAAYFDFGLPVA